LENQKRVLLLVEIKSFELTINYRNISYNYTLLGPA